MKNKLPQNNHSQMWRESNSIKKIQVFLYFLLLQEHNCSPCLLFDLKVFVKSRIGSYHRQVTGHTWTQGSTPADACVTPHGPHVGNF